MDPTSNSPHSNHSSYQRVPSLTSGLISEDTIISPGPSEPLRSNRKHSQYDDDDQEGNPVSSMPLHDEIPYGPQPPVLHTTATFTFTHPLKPILLLLFLRPQPQPFARHSPLLSLRPLIQAALPLLQIPSLLNFHFLPHLLRHRGGPPHGRCIL
ncbi:hypothetical protein BC939DRAFT_271988 [Gamsiella multidivaricata]|uniref:uncharacterized protein n=1 Tax=Gamsiella multidivaricata TaxID=101098 RepID=UPI00222094B6|nr:uncharacterized protein BC939DRAFT_271988 [Gamsiella multidivaricata]KAI7818975.1 hypothetical protein BC939DRAFT_271988 [Gamsiella multidivaricata]